MTQPAEAFAAAYGRAPDGVWAAPGRVNLLGEHVDYNDGPVLPFALDRRTSVAAAHRGDGGVRVRSRQRPDEDVELALRDLAPGVGPSWAGYVVGVLWALREEGHAVPGADLLVDGRVPAGAGLSSSAALECATALAAAELAGLDVDRARLAAAARRAENDYVGVPTGVMDQMASMLCVEGHAMLLDTRDGATEQIPFDVTSAGCVLLVMDTKVKHALADGAYADRHRESAEAAAALGARTLREADAAALGRLDDDVLRRRARHVVTEIARVLDAVSALRHGDLRALGPLMTASHASLRDDYEVSCQELDTAVEAALSAGAWGARMTGGGFGGSAIALAPLDRSDAVTAAVVGAFEDERWDEPDVFPTVPSAGATRVG